MKKSTTIIYIHTVYPLLWIFYANIDVVKKKKKGTPTTTTPSTRLPPTTPSHPSHNSHDIANHMHIPKMACVFPVSPLFYNENMICEDLDVQYKLLCSSSALLVLAYNHITSTSVMTLLLLKLRHRYNERLGYHVRLQKPSDHS